VNLKKEIRLESIVISLIVSVMTILLLSILTSLSPASITLGSELLAINTQQTESANAVTSVVAYFRGLDTLGEVTVLFLSIFGISLSVEKSSMRNILSYENSLLRSGTKVLFPLILIFGLYIIVHGHLSPGGGFQGGVIIASAFLLRFLSAGDGFTISHKIVSIMESFSGASFVLVGVLAVAVMGVFFGNFFPLGEMGSLFSGGLIPLIYIFVGIKVAAEITALVEYAIRSKDV